MRSGFTYTQNDGLEDLTTHKVWRWPCYFLNCGAPEISGGAPSVRKMQPGRVISRTNSRSLAHRQVASMGKVKELHPMWSAVGQTLAIPPGFDQVEWDHGSLQEQHVPVWMMSDCGTISEKNRKKGDKWWPVVMCQVDQDASGPFEEGSIFLWKW